MVIFRGYVKLPEGIRHLPGALFVDTSSASSGRAVLDLKREERFTSPGQGVSAGNKTHDIPFNYRYIVDNNGQ